MLEDRGLKELENIRERQRHEDSVRSVLAGDDRCRAVMKCWDGGLAEARWRAEGRNSQSSSERGRFMMDINKRWICGAAGRLLFSDGVYSHTVCE